MSTEHIINGHTFIQATIAAKNFGYTKDYLLLLIKANKIDGKKIGNKWYVNVSSAEKFFDESKNKKIERSEKIRRERKLELAQHAKVDTKAVSFEHSLPSSNVALAETFAIAVLGLIIGAMGYVGNSATVASVAESNANIFATLADSLYGFVSPKSVSVTVPTDTAVSSDVMGVPTDASISEEQKRSFVVAPLDQFSTSSIASVSESFSDEVEVLIDPENPDTGIITPIFKEEKGEEYRFLMVPVKVNKPAS